MNNIHASGLRFNPDNPHAFPYDKIAAAVDWINGEVRKNNWPDLVLYTRDEPAFPLPGFRYEFDQFRNLPLRLTTAMGGTSAWGYADMHDLWIVHDGSETPELLAEAERMGAEVWTYSYRILREGSGSRLLL